MQIAGGEREREKDFDNGTEPEEIKKVKRSGKYKIGKA